MGLMSFLEFHTNTYEQVMPPAKPTALPDFPNIELEQIHRGRPPNLRVPYKIEAGKPNKGRVFRSPGHENLPRFVGKWFERSNDPGTREMYCASMLLLLKPWSTLKDLKADFPTFDASWQQYSKQLDNAGLTFISNVNYYYECMDNARARREELYPTTYDATGMEEEPMEDFDHSHEDLMDDFMEIIHTEDDIENARKNKHDDRDKLLAEAAMIIAQEKNIFAEIPRPTLNPPSQRATIAMMTTINAWDASLKATKRKHTLLSIEDETHDRDPALTESAPNLSTTNIEPYIRQLHGEITAQNCANPENNPRPIYSTLNEDQKCAHDIVYNILLRHIAG